MTKKVYEEYLNLIKNKLREAGIACGDAGLPILYLYSSDTEKKGAVMIDREEHEVVFIRMEPYQDGPVLSKVLLADPNCDDKIVQLALEHLEDVTPQ